MKHDFHTTHCCVVHGCKYGDDDCHVANGKTKQDSLCEDCEPYYNFELAMFKYIIDMETMLSIMDMKQSFIVVPKICDVNIGQIISISVSNSNNLEQELAKHIEKYRIDPYSQKLMFEQYRKKELVCNGIVSNILLLAENKILSFNY